MLISTALFSVHLFGEGQQEEAFPSKPVTLLIPFGAGGSADLMGRALADAGTEYLGQPIVPVNKPGAGGGVMYQELINTPPDGYNVGWNSTSIVTVTNIGNVPFKYDAFDYVCRIGYTAMPLAARKGAPFKTLDEMVTYAKNNPGAVKIGNAGTGSATHLVAVAFAVKAGIDVVHVPLGAERRLPSLLGGEVDVICVPLPEIAPHVESGDAVLLGFPTEKRDETYSDVPTFREEGYDVVIELFRGISVAKGTPKNVIKKLSDVFEEASKDPKFIDLADKNGFIIDFMGQAEFEKYLAVQDALVAEAMKAGGLVE